MPAGVFAKHLVGGDVTYRWLRKSGSSDVYEITFKIYRDCSSSTDFDQSISVGFYEAVPNATPSLAPTIYFTFPRVRKVEPPAGGSLCSFKANACLEEAIYRSQVILPETSSGWHMIFIRCCRNNAVVNLKANGTEQEQGQTYYAFIPPSSERNSSPIFSEVPVPYLCVQDSVKVANTAYDPDGDSLVYRVIQPFQGGKARPDSLVKPEPPARLTASDTPLVDYRNGYSYLKPFGSNGLFTIDPQTGITTIYAPAQGWYVVAIEVQEWRNGKLLSTTRRDLEVIVINCPINPAPKRAQVNGSVAKDFYIKAGESFSTAFRFVDDDDQTIYGSGELYDNSIPGNKPVIDAQVSGGSDVKLNFSWQTQCFHARKAPYVLNLKVEDGGCPPKTTYESIRIHVVPYESTKPLIGPVNACAGGYPATYKVSNQNPNNNFYWEITGGTIVGPSDKNTVDVLWGNGPTGKIRYLEYNSFGCPGDTVELNIKISPRPVKKPIDGPGVLCIDKIGTYSIQGESTSTFVWATKGGSLVSTKGPQADVRWMQPDTGEVSVVEINRFGCPGDTIRIPVYVSAPKADSVYGSPSVCPNIKNIDYWVTTQPGATYQWFIEGGTQSAGGNTGRIKVNWGNKGAGKVSVVETTKYGCIGDTHSLTVIIDYTLYTPPMEGDTVVCEFTGGVPYEVVYTRGSNYDWKITGGSIVSGQGTNKVIVDWGATGFGGLWVQETSYDSVNGQGCIGIPVLLSVRLSPIPTTSPIDGLPELCEEQGVSYRVTGLPKSTYVWTVSGDAILQTDSSDSVSVYFPHEGQYTLTVMEISIDSCFGPTLSLTIIAHPNPETKPITGADTVCTTTLQNNPYAVKGFPTSSYQWSIQNGVLISGQGTSRIIVNWTEAGIGEVSVTEITDFGCIGDTLRYPVTIDSPYVDIELVTTAPANDAIIEVYWTVKHDENLNKPFNIYRRTSKNGDWNLIDSAPSSARMYTDRRVQTGQQAYYYRVSLRDLCNTTISSPQHRSILAKINLENDSFMRVNWNPYVGWNEGGVGEYLVYHSTDDDTSTQIVRSLNDTTYQMLDDLTAFRHCFRIGAVNADNDSLISLSNRICMEFEPLLWIPNAFSPGSWDQVNNTFRVVAVRMRSYELQIYNRWGGLVFTSDDPAKQWDGTYKGGECPEGVYLYKVNVIGQKKNIFRSGTLHLLR